MYICIYIYTYIHCKYKYRECVEEEGRQTDVHPRIRMYMHVPAEIIVRMSSELQLKGGELFFAIRSLGILAGWQARPISFLCPIPPVRAALQVLHWWPDPRPAGSPREAAELHLGPVGIAGELQVVLTTLSQCKGESCTATSSPRMLLSQPVLKLLLVFPSLSLSIGLPCVCSCFQVMATRT